MGVAGVSSSCAFRAAIAADGGRDPVVWYSPLYFHRSDDNRMVKPDRAIAAGQPVGDYLFAEDGLMQTSTLVIPRALFTQVGFDQGLRCLEDLDLCLRLEEAGALTPTIPVNFDMARTPTAARAPLSIRAASQALRAILAS